MIIFAKKINMKAKILAVIRHTLTFAGGFLAMKGYADAEEIETISGAVIALVGGVWSIIEKNKRQ
jgi:hypothetical protein